MEQLPQTDSVLTKTKNVFVVFWRQIRRFFVFLRRSIKTFWNWLLIRLPFLESFVDRHFSNPATIFTDLAILILGLYVIFGITGAILIYDRHSESLFAENLSLLYPLPAAKVDNNIIWAHEFLLRVRYINTFYVQAASDTTSTSKPPTANQLRTQVMQGLIQNQVLIFEAKKFNISVSSSEVDADYNQQLTTTPDLATQIKSLYGMSVSDFKEILAEQILQEKVESVAVEQIRVSQILTTTLATANQAESDLKGGKSFVAAAAEYSQDAQTKNSGGDLGFWTKGELASQINQNFENTAFSLTVGQVSAPIQSQYGYSIITVTSKTGTNYETFYDWYAGVLKSYSVSQYIK